MAKSSRPACDKSLERGIHTEGTFSSPFRSSKNLNLHDERQILDFNPKVDSKQQTFYSQFLDDHSSRRPIATWSAFVAMSQLITGFFGSIVLIVIVETNLDFSGLHSLFQLLR